MKTAVVLSGGASHGSIQVGVLMALASRGIRPDLVVGTSAGALNAAWLACNPDGDLRDLARIWTSLRRSDVFPISPTAGIRGALGWADHLVPASGVERLISRHTTFRRIEDAPLRLAVVATEVLTGEERVLKEGDLAAAVLASSAIPGVFPPVEIDGVPLMDGGIADNTPISAAVALGADRVFVVPTGYACALTRPPRGALALLLHSLTLMVEQRLIHDVARFEPMVELHVIPPLCPLAVSPADFSQAANLMTRSRRAAGRWLDRGLPQRGQARFLGWHRHPGQYARSAAAASPARSPVASHS